MRTALLATLLACAGCSSTTAPTPNPDTLLWTEACVRISGCAPYASTASPYFTCQVGTLTFAGTGPARCALSATECDAAVACFGAGSAPIACAPGIRARCEGDVLHECDAGLELELSRDCAAEGLRCRTNDFGDPHCAREGSCTEGTCDGNVLVYCFGGIPVPWDICGNGRCVAADGFPQCAGEGEPCEAPLFRCDGDVAVSCKGGFVHREQCRAGACRTDDGARCVSTEECTPRCEGTSLVRCVEGEMTRYDCAAWGFAECAGEGEGARCR